MEVFAAAAEGREPHLANLYFDVATIVAEDTTAADAATVAKRIRQLGSSRVLYGSDLNPPGGGIGRGWEIFRSKVPITANELQQIMKNQTRFVRSSSTR